MVTKPFATPPNRESESIFVLPKVLSIALLKLSTFLSVFFINSLTECNVSLISCNVGFNSVLIKIDVSFKFLDKADKSSSPS